MDRLRLAWNAGDATAYADEFTDDAMYVIFAGIVSHGREQIRADHVPVLERWQRGSTMSMRVLEAKMIGADAAVVLTDGGIGKGRSIHHDKVQTYVFVREGERWRCAAFQNTKVNKLFAFVNARARRRLANA